MKKFAACMALAALVITGCEKKAPAKTMNVVIVVVDAMRADHLTPYGHFIPTTPFLEKLATQGVIYENAYAQAPWTNSSIASMFTGMDPSTHRVIKIEGKDTYSLVPDVLSNNALTMAEVFENNGYDTLLVSANPWFFQGGGLAQGFTEVSIYNASTLSSDVNNMAVKLLNSRLDKSKPFFMYLHYMDLHGVYRNPPEPYTHMFTDFYKLLPPRFLTDEEKVQYDYIYENLPAGDLREYMVRFDRSIRYVDTQIEWLWNELGIIGMKGNTIFIVTADHGEAFLEHGETEHGTGLHQEQIKVPLIVWRPDTVVQGRVSVPVQLMDLFPTFVEFAGLDVPKSFEPDGESFARILAGKKGWTPRSAWSENHIREMNMVTYIIGGVKYFYDLESEKIVERYNLLADPGEKDNLVGLISPDDSPKIENIIRARLKADMAKAKRLGMGQGTSSMPDDTKEDLKALGYIE